MMNFEAINSWTVHRGGRDIRRDFDMTGRTEPPQHLHERAIASLTQTALAMAEDKNVPVTEEHCALSHEMSSTGSVGVPKSRYTIGTGLMALSAQGHRSAALA
jgi:hypothetical protein